MKHGVVMVEAGFGAVLGTVLLLGVAYADIDHRDFPGPASDGGIAHLALALFVLAVVLATLVKNEAVTGTALRALAGLNAALAVVLAAWATLATGFSHTGEALVWAAVAVLALLAAVEASLSRR